MKIDVPAHNEPPHIPPGALTGMLDKLVILPAMQKRGALSPYCLCVHQPFAEWIASGIKTLEVRNRRINYRGPLLIAATRRPKVGNLPTGSIVCRVDVVGCRPWEDRDVIRALCEPGHGKWCWELANVKRFEVPVPIKGQQGLFRVNILKEIRRR